MAWDGWGWDEEELKGVPKWSLFPIRSREEAEALKRQYEEKREKVLRHLERRTTEVLEDLPWDSPEEVEILASLYLHGMEKYLVRLAGKGTFAEITGYGDSEGRINEWVVDWYEPKPVLVTLRYGEKEIAVPKEGLLDLLARALAAGDPHEVEGADLLAHRLMEFLR